MSPVLQQEQTPDCVSHVAGEVQLASLVQALAGQVLLTDFGAAITTKPSWYISNNFFQLSRPPRPPKSTSLNVILIFSFKLKSTSSGVERS